MKNLFNRFKWLRLILGLVIFSLGLIILLITVNEDGDPFKLVALIVSIYCFAVAVFNLLVTIFMEKKAGFNGISSNILVSGLLIGIGIALLSSNIVQNFVDTLVADFLPWVMISISAVVLLKFILLVSNKTSRIDFGAWIRALIIWVILLTTGLVILFTKNDITTFIYGVVGIIVMVVGLLVISFGIVTMVNERREKKQPKTSKKIKKDHPKATKPNGTDSDLKLVESKDVVDVQTPVIKEDK